MVNSEYSPRNYKSAKISIEATIKNQEMPRLVPDRLKTKKMCTNAVKKVAVLIHSRPTTCVIKRF